MTPAGCSGGAERLKERPRPNPIATFPFGPGLDRGEEKPMSTSTKRAGRIVAMAAASAALITTLLASPAVATGASIMVSPATVPIGGDVTISGVVPTTGPASCPQPDGVTITSTAQFFPGDGFGPTVSRDATGAFQVVYTVPASTPPGMYAIGMRCSGGNVGVKI